MLKIPRRARPSFGVREDSLEEALSERDGQELK